LCSISEGSQLRMIASLQYITGLLYVLLTTCFLTLRLQGSLQVLLRYNRLLSTLVIITGYFL
jgi:hypothetical protein